MDFGQLPQGMDFFKQFVAQSTVASTDNTAAANATKAVQADAFATMPSMNATLSQAMAQYMMPTLDLGELDKRLSDLRTVLQFMELNTTLLRQSLQALELQRNAVASFQTMMHSHTASASPSKAE